MAAEAAAAVAVAAAAEAAAQAEEQRQVALASGVLLPGIMLRVGIDVGKLVR